SARLFRFLRHNPFGGCKLAVAIELPHNTLGNLAVGVFTDHPVHGVLQRHLTAIDGLESLGVLAIGGAKRLPRYAVSVEVLHVRGGGALRPGSSAQNNQKTGETRGLHTSRLSGSLGSRNRGNALGGRFPYNENSVKTFYIETFGCQMNVHDSEKVIGALLSQGYRQVDTPEQAELVFYNTCSIRDKAEQKVFSRLQQFKKEHGKGKTFAVLGCVAQQEGHRIFEKAPHVSLVCGSASYNKLPQMLVQLETGDRRVTGLDLDTDETFETEFTRRDNPYRAYITIIEGCDKHCAYCVVPFTRGPERSRTSRSVLDEARQLADAGYSEIQLLGQNVNSYRDPSPAGVSFAELLAKVAEVPGVRRVRFTTSHPRDFTREIVEAIESHPALCSHVHLPVQSGSTEVLRLMKREYTR